MINSKGKKIILSLLISLGILSIIPFSLVFTDQLMPKQFSQSYYGELKYMHDHLKETEKKKIVIIGNSAVAFDVDSALIEEELHYDSLDYEVCNFGLYGAIGTKAMLELAENDIKEGDIVLLMPEEFSQSMSTYFSPLDLWYALENDESMIWDFSLEDQILLCGEYTTYLQNKYTRFQKQETTAESIYSLASFDNHCDLTQFSREQNIMADTYDSDNPIELTDSLYTEDFITMINDYASDFEKKGAQVFYTFAPMNELALNTTEDDDIYSYYQGLQNQLNFPILSDPRKAIMKENWFYDSNYHLNSHGMKEFTLNLIDDLKNEFHLTSKNRSEHDSLPDLPVMETITGDNEMESYFTYEQNNDSYKIVGIKEEHQNLSDYILPSTYQDKPVISFNKDVFAGKKTLKTITIQNNIKTLYDDSFQGCENLEKIILQQSDPSSLSVGFNLLEGVNEACQIQVPKGCSLSYELNYFWGHYAGKFVEEA